VSNKISFTVAACLLLFVLGGGVIFAASGPQFMASRALSMGNAFVAVADTRDALHYNPAGLNRIDRNGESLRERVDARATLIGLHAPWAETRRGWGYLPDDSHDPPPFEPLFNDSTDLITLMPRSSPTLVRQIAAFRAFEFARRNFGIAWWSEADVEYAYTAGVVLPHYTRTVQSHAVLQAAFAGDAWERLSWGMGARLVTRRARTDVFHPVDLSFWNNVSLSRSDIREQAQAEAWSTLARIPTSGTGYGFDFGLLWQQTPWLRFGAATQNIGLVLDGERITPKLTLGAAATISALSTQGARARTVLVAADYEDALDTRLEVPARFNLGAELTQTLTNWFDVGLGGGFKGGYWSAGLHMAFLQTVHLELMSWGEEGGDYLGDHELRRYTLNLSVGL
jgi:hypothetical protein